MHKHYLSQKKLGISKLGRLKQNDVHMRGVRNVFLFYTNATTVNSFVFCNHAKNLHKIILGLESKLLYSTVSKTDTNEQNCADCVQFTKYRYEHSSLQWFYVNCFPSEQQNNY
jgi:hypothetical protein